MSEPAWLPRDLVLALHDRLIAEFGGAPGTRDLGLLDSALARPRNRFAYESPSVFTLAATYADGLLRNHPFVDGNKRVALVAAVVFLEQNGFRFLAAESDAARQTWSLAAAEIDELAYASWLETNSEPA